MNEATVKRSLVRVLRERVDARGGVVYRHEDIFTGGIPDVSVSLNGGTVWAEVKLDRPGRRSKVTALQRDALRRLRGYLLVYRVGPKGTLCVSVLGFNPNTGEFEDAYGCGFVRPGEVHERVANFLVSGLE
jgi:hypothetical protein